MCITEYMPGGDLERYYMVPWCVKPIKKAGESMGRFVKSDQISK